MFESRKIKAQQCVHVVMLLWAKVGEVMTRLIKCAAVCLVDWQELN